MRFLLDTARKDLRRRLADPLALVLWIMIPLVIGGLMSLVIGGGGGAGVPRVRLLLADLDDTFLSNLLSGGRGPSGPADFIDVEPVSLEEGRARIEAGDASALLVVPEGFTMAFLREEPSTLTLLTNPAQRISPGILREGLEILVEGQFYLHRLVGEPLRQMAEGPPEGQDFFDDAQFGALSADINARMRRLQDVLFPPVLELRAQTSESREDKPFDFALFVLPGILVMSLLFVAQGVSEDLWKEKEFGALRRLISAPQSPTAFLAGKFLTGALLLAAVAAAGALIAVLGFGRPAAAILPAILWCAFCGTALLALFSLIQLFATSRRAGSVLTSLVLFPLMMIGGSFFPFGAMPDWMVSIGRWTPNGQAVLQLQEILRGTPDLAALGRAALLIALPGALCFGATALRLRGRFLAH